MAEAEETAGNPYELITDALVTETLKEDVGSNAELISWKAKDFTKKGDNYSSIVTSIEVCYSLNETEKLETSYVAKLNPLRPKNSFTDFLDIFYSREPVILKSIVGGMNLELEKLNLEPIKKPKIFASNSESRKQIFISEDLRPRKFRMYDRRKGMDLNHALLVVKELGRFHSSSLLYEDTLQGKSISESCGLSEDPFQNETGTQRFFGAMLKGQFKNTCDLLEGYENYEKCRLWLQDKMEDVVDIFLDVYKPSKKFNTWQHGDCWTNNFLFKYDEEGNPTDIRFVDFQNGRSSSPASDLNYFLYSSLNGKDRRKNFRKLLVTYFLSFSEVFLLAGKELPFTFQELQEEMENRIVLGLFTGILILPIILAEGEDEIMNLEELENEEMDSYVETQKEKFLKVSQRGGGPFKERFLSLFDDMIQFNVFNK